MNSLHRAMLTGMLLVFAPLALPAAPPCETIGEIGGLTFEGRKIVAATREQLAIEREGAALPGSTGMPLCARDLVTTGPRVSAVVVLTREDQTTVELTLSPLTTTELTGKDSVFLKVGRFFASLTGIFNVNTSFVRLGAKGTQFSVTVNRDGDVSALQLEGELLLTPIGAELPPYGYGFAAQEPPSRRKPTQVQRLTVVHLRRGSAEPQLSPASRDTTQRVIDDYSSVIIETRPELPSRSVIPVYATRQERAQIFREARFLSVWQPEQTDSFEKLANVYADWGEGRAAAETFRKAGEAQQRDPLYLNQLGNIYRLAGDLKRAEELYRRALTIDKQFAFPYNGLGDVYHDRAAAALDRGDIPLANQLLEKARSLYLESLNPNLWGKGPGHNRSVPLYNLGEVYILLAEAGPKDRVTDYLNRAADSFDRALGESPTNAYAQVGLSRVTALRAGSAGSSESKQQLDSAATGLRAVLDRFPGFAVAALRLGEVLDQQGHTKEASQQFQRATQLDPSFPQAFYKLGQSLAKQGRNAEASLYLQTYRRVESPVFRDGARMRDARKFSALPTATQFQVPDLKGKTLDEARSLLEGQGLTLGRVRSLTSDAPKGTVFRQGKKAGEQLSAKARVDVYLSSGPSDIGEKLFPKIPSVIGLSFEDAKKKLEGIGLQVGTIEREYDKAPAGQVLRQDPPEGEQGWVGRKVKLVISAGLRPPD